MTETAEQYALRAAEEALEAVHQAAVHLRVAIANMKPEDEKS